MFGCTVVPLTIKKVQGNKLDAEALLGCTGTSVILALEDGEIIMDDLHSNVQLEFGAKGQIIITASGKVLECQGNTVETF